MTAVVVALVVAAIAGATAVWVVRSRPLTTSPRVVAPAPLLAGSGILFVRHIDATQANIFVGSPDGGRILALTTERARDGSPSWSPDRRHIAFQSDRSGTDQIYTMDATGADVHQLTIDGTNSSPAWSPSGELITFVHQSGLSIWLSVMASDGSDPRPIVALATATAAPSWSPDGSEIAYSSGVGSDSHLNVVPAAGGAPRQLTDGASRDRRPSWSPDGTQIAFARVTGHAPSQIYVIASSGGSARALTSGPADCTGPAWSSDGSEIVFVRTSGSSSTLWIMRAAGFDAHPMNDTGGAATGPEWG